MKKIIRNILISILSLAIVVAVAVPVGFTFSRKKEKKRDPNQIEYAFALDTGAASADKSKKGGAIFVEEGGNYTMSGGTISGKKNTYGGAVFISKNATFTMTGGTIKNCQAKYGGAIYVSSGATCYINGGSITGNTAEVAPAIYVEGNGRVVQSNSPEIKDNTIGKFMSIGPEVVLGKAVGSTKLKTIEFGTYPKTYVGDSMNATLESWYVGKSSVKTYTCRQSTWTAYSYTDGNIYARGSALKAVSDSVYKDGTAATTRKMTWFKVEPITWFILNYDAWKAGTEDIELYSELVIAGDIYFNASESDGNSWENSYIRNWCKNTFFKEAFDATEQAMIKDTKVGNNVTSNYDSATSDSSGTATTDKIYLKSYWEVSSGLFTSNDMRMAANSDFAIGNNAYCSSSGSSYATAYRTDRSGYYWLRSAGWGASCACLVDVTGDRLVYILSTVNSPYGGVRPALHIDL